MPRTITARRQIERLGGYSFVMTFLRTAVAQLANVVGDIQGNAERVAEAMGWAERASADVLVLPELVLTGHPVADLVLHREFVAEAEEAVAGLAEESGDTVTVLSTVTGVKSPQRPRLRLEPEAAGTPVGVAAPGAQEPVEGMQG